VDLTLSILGWALALGALAALHTAFWSRRFRVYRRADEVHFARAEDGWALALHRYRPAVRRYHEPLLLCHGLGANRYNFDLDGRASLARHLSERGFDVWVLELRGAGLSDGAAWFTGRRWRWDFDTHLAQDIPAALGLVRQVTGVRRVFWLGHSMGGMLGYGLLPGAGPDELAGLVAVASPGRLDRSALLQPAWLARLASVLPSVPLGPLGRFFSPLLGQPPAFIARPFYHPGGMEPRLVRRALCNLNESPCSALVRQFLGWGESGRFTSRDGARDYLAELAHARAPVLLLAAHRDQLAPPDSVIPVYEALGSPDRQIRIFGLDAGDDRDFGHGDLVLGRHAAELVYPEISEWLEARATLLPGASQPPPSTPA
jgi:pimeloyl-ACP methyl ester carboxylesterase